MRRIVAAAFFGLNCAPTRRSVEKTRRFVHPPLRGKAVGGVALLRCAAQFLTDQDILGLVSDPCASFLN
jgi:hypothetical protein